MTSHGPVILLCLLLLSHAACSVAQGLNSCVYGTAPRFVLSSSKNFTFEQSGIRAEAFARWPSVAEVYNVIVSPETQDFSNPITIFEPVLNSSDITCTGFWETSDYSLLDGRIVNRTQLRTDYFLTNGARMEITVAHFNESSTILYGGIPVTLQPELAKFTLRITDWPFQNRSRNVLLLSLDFFIRHFGLTSFPIPYWVGQSRYAPNRTLGVDFSTLRGLKFQAEMQMWAAADSQYTVIYHKSVASSSDFQTIENSDGSETFRMRLTVAFSPFDTLEWDPSFYLLLDASEPPFQEESPQEAPLINQLILYTVPPVTIAVLVAIVVSALVIRHRARAQSATLHLKLRASTTQ